MQSSLTPHAIKRVALLLAITAMACLAWLLYRPSESGAAILAGYSAYRLVLAAGLVTMVAGMLALAWSGRGLTRLAAMIETSPHAGLLFWLALAAIAVFGWTLLFTWLLFPAALRPPLTWLMLASGSAAWLTWHMRLRFGQVCPLPRLSMLQPAQRSVLLVLALICTAAFTLYGVVNWQGADDYEMFFRQSSDEAVMYPILMDSMKPGDDLRATLYHVFIYEDYHYGYPFYAVSQAILLPVKWITGEGFERNLRINMWLLRQITSVLPLLLAALVVVYLADRWRSYLRSILLLILLLTLNGMDGYNRQFWHPDGLNALFVMLVIYFLYRDNWRFGCNFYLAAFFCGLSVSTRVYGVFFVLSIGGYLIAAILSRRLALGQAVVRGALFMIIMATTTLLTSPYVFESGARAKLLAIFNEKQTEMAVGYDEVDIDNIYRTGWDAWLPFFHTHFSANWFSLFLMISIVAGMLLSRRQHYYGVLLGWLIMLGGYLIYFVVVKSAQYMIPLFLPMMGGVYGFYEALQARAHGARRLQSRMELLIFVLMLAQIGVNINTLLTK